MAQGAHFGDQVGGLKQGGGSVAAGADDLHMRGAAAEQIKYALQVKQSQMQCVVDFVEDDDVEVAGGDGGGCEVPGLGCGAVVLVGRLAAEDDG